MFVRVRFSFALLLVVAGLTGCGVLHFPWKKRPPKATAKVLQFVGTVMLVSEDPSFVLIDNGSLPPPSTGTVLTIENPGGTPVEMKVTRIQKPPFVVADIVKGTPKKGERFSDRPLGGVPSAGLTLRITARDGVFGRSCPSCETV